MMLSSKSTERATIFIEGRLLCFAPRGGIKEKTSTWRSLEVVSSNYTKICSRYVVQCVSLKTCSLWIYTIDLVLENRKEIIQPAVENG